MRIRILSLGKVKQPFVLQGEAEYLKRLKPWVPVEIIELPNERFASLPEEQMKLREAELVLARREPNSFFVALDEHGKQFSSPALAEWFQQRMNQGTSSITLAIGGAYGWHESILKAAQLTLSLSELTFPYQLTRLILVEQIYRVQTLLRGMPYHKS